MRGFRIGPPLPPEERPALRHPLRDGAIVYAVLAVIVVAVAAATGGGVLRAAGIAAAFFVLALGYTWLRVRRDGSRKRPPIH